MIHPGLRSGSTMAGNSAKPYAIMEFDSLLATALSCQYLEKEGLVPAHYPHISSPHAIDQNQQNQHQNHHNQHQNYHSQHQNHHNQLQSQHSQLQSQHSQPAQNHLAVSPGQTFQKDAGHLLDYPVSPRSNMNLALPHWSQTPHGSAVVAQSSPNPQHSPFTTFQHAAWTSSEQARSHSRTFSSGSSIPEFHEFVNHFLHSPSSTNNSNTTTSTLQSGGPVAIGDGLRKPGPNLIKPVAYKPVRASPARSPPGQMTRRQPGGDDHVTGSHDMRPQGLKLGTSMLGIHGSPDSQNGKLTMGAFNAMAKHPHHSPGGHQMASAPHGLVDNAHHPPPHPYPASVNSSHNSSLHNSSTSSHHNASTSSYCNLPGNSQHNMSANSSHLSGADEASFSNELPRPSDRPDSVPSLNVSRVSSHAAEGVLQTPSPSDSGVGELEAMLREKDAEINTLREVMDRNERAIFQVYEERRNVWLQDTQELKDEYERKLKIQSRKSYKTEQVLSLQVYKLQQEQKTLQEEKAKITSERDAVRQQLEESQAQISQLKSQLDTAAASGKAGGGQNKVDSTDKPAEGGEDVKEKPTTVQEELALKNKELITLKSQLHSLQVDMEKKNKEVAEKVREASAKVEQVNSLKEELRRVKDPPALAEASAQTHVPGEVTAAENMKPSMLGERDRAISGLQEELLALQAELASLKEEHEKEREQWLDEKNKVVRYQKQLQLNYVQMQRKNTTLETEVQQLTLELENRDMKLIALSGEESVC